MKSTHVVTILCQYAKDFTWLGLVGSSFYLTSGEVWEASRHCGRLTATSLANSCYSGNNRINGSTKQQGNKATNDLIRDGRKGIGDERV